MKQHGREPDGIVLTDQVSKLQSALPRRLVPIAPDRDVHQCVPELGSFVGRVHEIAVLKNLLLNENVRLITLTGPGGVGKTRLTRELASEIADDFSDGVVFCSLAPLQDATNVIHTLADTIGLHNPTSPDAKDRMNGWLRSRDVLIVMDNFEHVLDASTDVADILHECRHVSIVVTSRVPLDVYGEHIYELTPLSVPTKDELDELDKPLQSDAVQLLLDRGRSVNSQLLAEDGAMSIAAEICEHLDGLPLAIELAAARLNVLSLSGLRDHFEIGLSLLSTAARDVPDRLRTMRNAIAWSYELLAEEDQRNFLCLTIFADGFDLDSARAMMDSPCSELDAVENLSRLRKSSLIYSETRSDGAVRFRMLQTIREYGYEVLKSTGELDVVEARFLIWAAEFAEITSRDIVGENQRTGLKKLDLERCNIQHSLGTALLRKDVVSGVRICSALWLYWNTRGLINEGISWIEQLMATSSPMPDSVLAAALFTRGILYSHLGDVSTSLADANESLEIAERIKSPIQIALALYLRGLVANRQQHWDDAEHDIDRAIAHMLEAGETTAEPALLNDLGRTAYLRGDVELAEDRFIKALQLAKLYRLPRSQSMILHNLGNLAADQNDYARAAKLNLESLEINLEHGDDWHIMLPIISLVRNASLAGNITLAAHLTGYAESLVDQPGITLWDWKLPEDYQDVLATTHRILESKRLQPELAVGRRLSSQQMIAEVRVLCCSPEDDEIADITELLTPRELDVTRLLLEGLSDKEIGESLYISHRTAQTHLGSVYKKLGVHSRPEAIDFLNRRGWTEKLT